MLKGAAEVDVRHHKGVGIGLAVETDAEQATYGAAGSVRRDDMTELLREHFALTVAKANGDPLAVLFQCKQFDAAQHRSARAVQGLDEQVLHVRLRKHDRGCGR